VSRPAPLGRAIAAQTVTELRLTLRRGENILVTLVVPIVVLLFFASLPVIETSTERPVDFLLPGAIALAIIAAGLVNLGIATAYERHYGVLKRLGGSPLTRGRLLAAKMLAILAIEVVQVVLLVAIAIGVLGWAPGLRSEPLVAVVALLLGTLTFTSLGMLLAGALRAEATLAIANGLFIACLLLGSIVLPADHLPGPLEAIARALPANALSEAFRVGLGVGGDALGSLAILAAWAVGAIVLTVRTFRWE
jgi:ABC-2 type transport system permease protein